MENGMNLKPVVRPDVVLREESDDWALLHDPQTGASFGVDPVSVFIWKRLDGSRTPDDILNELQNECKEVPPEAGEEIRNFIESLREKGLLS